jgi:hypothetical protein
MLFYVIRMLYVFGQLLVVPSWRECTVVGGGYGAVGLVWPVEVHSSQHASAAAAALHAWCVCLGCVTVRLQLQGDAGAAGDRQCTCGTTCSLK